MNTKQKKTLTHAKLLNMLVCPITGGNLSLNKKGDELISLTGKLAFPIRDGIPIMIESEARHLSDKELKVK